MRSPYAEFKKAVCPDDNHFVYDLYLRKMHQRGLSAEEAIAECREQRLYGRRSDYIVPDGKVYQRKVRLSNETVIRRLADAVALCCRKLLKHRMEEDMLQTVRALKEQCDDVCLRPRD